MKHLEIRKKYSSARRIFNPFLGVSSGDETLRLMLDILHNPLAFKLAVHWPHSAFTYSASQTVDLETRWYILF